MTTLDINGYLTVRGDLTLPPDLLYEAREFKRRIFLELIQKYMTTGTATVPDSIAKDAREDVARLKAAYDELMKVAPQ